MQTLYLDSVSNNRYMYILMYKYGYLISCPSWVLTMPRDFCVHYVISLCEMCILCHQIMFAVIGAIWYSHWNSYRHTTHMFSVELL